jgi:hypothetical protein
MNVGAKVFEVGIPIFGLDRFPETDVPLGTKLDVRDDNDWCRLCPGACVPDSGDDISVDLGLPPTLLGLVDGEPALAKGLPRLCAAFCAIMLIQSDEFSSCAPRLNYYSYKT